MDLSHRAVIAPGEFKVIFGDGQPEKSSGNEWHTSFRLAAPDGAVVLLKDRRILDYINYSNMNADNSYGPIRRAVPRSSGLRLCHPWRRQ